MSGRPLRLKRSCPSSVEERRAGVGEDALVADLDLLDLVGVDVVRPDRGRDLVAAGGDEHGGRRGDVAALTAAGLTETEAIVVRLIVKAAVRVAPLSAPVRVTVVMAKTPSVVTLAVP